MKAMNWTVFVCVIFMNANSLYAYKEVNSETEKQTGTVGARNVANAFMDKFLTRRNILGPNQVILGVPRRPEHLPKALRILPGHTLLRPSKSMLKSSVKFPLKDFGGSAVYGNSDNLGITWGKTRERIRFTDFRKANNLLKFLTRRNITRPKEVILGMPRRPEHLPKALRILPEHSLFRPSKNMIKSSVKDTQKDFGGPAVYGNSDNIGITWGKTRGRVRYADFRKTDNLLSELPSILGQIKPSTKNRNRQLVVIEIDPSELETIAESISGPINPFGTQVSEEEENNANEILDDLDARSYEDIDSTNFRRSKRKKRPKDDWIKSSGSTSSSSSSGSSSDSSSGSSSDSEKNPGNPFTIHKNKYKQNWMWNYKLDGDHMNVNPYAPQLGLLGPSGADLFFGRKWWYYNQDDYKPMGRRMNSI